MRGRNGKHGGVVCDIGHQRKQNLLQKINPAFFFSFVALTKLFTHKLRESRPKGVLNNP